MIAKSPILILPVPVVFALLASANAQDSSYERLESEAKENGVGIWAHPDQAENSVARRTGSSRSGAKIRPTPQTENQTTIGPIVAARSNRHYNPRTYHDKYDDTTSCENGIWRIRPTKIGIIWFDFYHAEERKWYVNKNNLNLMTIVEGSTEWQNTELNHVQPSVEIISEGGVELHLRYHFDFPNKAKIYTDMFMQKGSPDLRFEVHQKTDSKKIIGFQWHVTFGQAEAVSQLHFGRESIYADKLPQSFPGSRLEVQLVRWYRNQRKLDFKFSGRETTKPDPSNPSWMTRVLGLEQHVTWGKPMRPQDHFAFEARDQPWQPDWKVPQTTPWIEGLWFIRNGPFLDGDQLTYGITNLKDYLRKKN